MKAGLKISCMVLTGILFFGMMSSTVSASENVGQIEMSVAYDVPANAEVSFAVAPRAIMLTDATIYTYFDASGMHVQFTTACNAGSSEIGVKDIKIQKKVGIFWITATTVGNGASYGTSTFSGSTLYGGAELGETYRTICTHYAIVNGTEYSLENTTGGYVYKY